MIITEITQPTIADIKRCPYYFAYGMNTNGKNMMLRTQSSKDMGAAVLPRHRLEFKTYCDVVYSGIDEVVGVLWRMTPHGLALLDRREGYPMFYDRDVFKVKSSNGKTYEAWVYYMVDNSPIEPPPDSYWKDINTGYREHGLPTIQLKSALDRSWDVYEKNYNKTDTGDKDELA